VSRSVVHDRLAITRRGVAKSPGVIANASDERGPGPRSFQSGRWGVASKVIARDLIARSDLGMGVPSRGGDA